MGGILPWVAQSVILCHPEWGACCVALDGPSRTVLGAEVEQVWVSLGWTVRAPLWYALGYPGSRSWCWVWHECWVVWGQANSKVLGSRMRVGHSGLPWFALTAVRRPGEGAHSGSTYSLQTSRNLWKVLCHLLLGHSGGSMWFMAGIFFLIVNYLLSCA